jgi:murein L,D-transpeptidase YcbB/YkuD
MRRYVLSAIAVAALASLSLPAHAMEPGAPDRLLTLMDAAGFKLQARLRETFRDISDAERRERGGMTEFYAERGNAFLWVDSDGLNDRAKAVARSIARARSFDLRPASYPMPKPREGTPAEAPDAQWLAEAEYRITRSVLAYVRHAQSGHVEPLSVTRKLDIVPDAPDPLEVLRGLARDGVDVASYMESFHPSQPQFVALLERLRELRRMSKTRMVRVPDGDLIRPGDTHPHVALVRERLGVEPASGEAGEERRYEERLVAAIKDFQRRNGLHVDGLIGPATRRALNRSPEDKIDTIRVNIERWRWLPNDLGKRHVRVNIPEFRVRVFDSGSTTFDERIVVGKTRFATPSLTDQIELVVFNPYWNVPYSIMKNEIMPRVRRDPRFLSRNNLQVLWRGRRKVDPYRVDWQEVNLSKVRLRQTPGASNALGKIKFLFPNKHSVYLHDTPTKHLFNRARRAYSHGCMRVRNPREFAAALMGVQGWSKQDITNAIARGTNRAVRLKEAVPVYLSYFTATATDSGAIQYFVDIYGHDGKTLKALERSQNEAEG